MTEKFGEGFSNASPKKLSGIRSLDFKKERVLRYYHLLLYDKMIYYFKNNQLIGVVSCLKIIFPRLKRRPQS